MLVMKLIKLLKKTKKKLFLYKLYFILTILMKNSDRTTKTLCKENKEIIETNRTIKIKVWFFKLINLLKYPF